MAKGSESKSIFYAKILETFEGSFMYNDGKEIRIPFKEDGKDIQLKIVATCAKDNVAAGADERVPGAAVVAQESTDVSMESQIEPSALKVSEEEKNKAAAMLAAMQF